MFGRLTPECLQPWRAGGGRVRRAVGAAGLAIAILFGGGGAFAAEPLPATDDRCMEVTDTFSLSLGVFSLAGYLLRGGTGEIITGSGPKCRGAGGDINACYHEGRIFPAGATVMFEDARGLPVAKICRLGIWD